MKIYLRRQCCLLKIVLIIIASPVFADDPLFVTHGPYLVDPAEDAMTVVWYTNKPCVSWVEYCGGDNDRTFPTWGGIVQKASNSRHGLIDAYSKIHKVRLRNLESGKKYKYRLVSKEILQFEPYEVLFGDTIVSDIFQFETLSTDWKSFSFGVVNDVHERSMQLDTLFQIMPWEEIDLMFFNGDMLDWLEDENQIFKGFIDVSVDRFAREIPLIYIRGNHETRGHHARHLMDFFPHTSGRYYYSFDHGPVHFIVLDSGEDKPDSHPVYAGLVDFDRYRDEQADWLKEDIQSEAFGKALYKIVLFHMPAFTDSRRHGSNYIAEMWEPVLNDGGIDLVLNAHTHRYARRDPVKGKNAFPVVILGTNMILRLDVSTEQLELLVKGIDGEMVDRFTIRAKK